MDPQDGSSSPKETASDEIPVVAQNLQLDSHGLAKAVDTLPTPAIEKSLEDGGAVPTPQPTTTPSVDKGAEVKYAPGGKVRLTDYPAIANAPLPAEGNGSFNNYHLAGLVLFAPAVILRLIPFVNPSWFSWTAYFFLVAIFGVPVTIGYWTVMSIYGPRKNEKVVLPGKPIEFYLDIKDPELKKTYFGHKKIPLSVFHEAFFEGKIDIKGDMLDLLEYRWDWASMRFTPELFKFVLFTMLPDVILHTAKQDETQIRDNYDRGNDFYEWFLGPQMIYTSGIISDPNKDETLEELQDNKLALVCSKLALKPTDKVLDIGCGWGTLAAFAAKNYGCDVTGVTLAKTQAQFGNERIRSNGIDGSRARILCLDYRDIPVTPGHYDKIVSLEMAEHVGIRHYSKFLSDVYNLLDDDGTFVFQVAGLRPHWQYFDLIWGLFMNDKIFRGADASCSLGWVINKLESAGFEIRHVDVQGISYSATIRKWYINWLKNKDKVVPKYGIYLYKVWEFFLASSVIVAREGGSSVFQITCHKNLNAYPRVEGIFSSGGLIPRPGGKKLVSVYK
ncbi:S-adenosyl-L-methionine-dependent methyltransferase [Violaceomyces palustris]|uniref:S-adenosyl-L-methionine-dependent methyltransferase n=1 Tax=Violaceomyces palustris TaxID=1673888 RepID=A0ACD0NXE5_9BASI|nr:S-adenosyl-L-methionine-dependent methyltransferase [Violaceomyces palustris]